MDIEKRKERAADALIDGLRLSRASVQKFQECLLELQDLPQTTGVRNTRQRIKYLLDYTDNTTKGIFNALKKSEMIDSFDEAALDVFEQEKDEQLGNVLI